MFDATESLRESVGRHLVCKAVVVANLAGLGGVAEMCDLDGVVLHSSVVVQGRLLEDLERPLIVVVDGNG